MLDKQKVFTAVVRGLHKQGWQRSTAFVDNTCVERCAYVGSDNRGCAIGVLFLGKVEIPPRFNTSDVRTLLEQCPEAKAYVNYTYGTPTDEDIEFLVGLQRLHDNSLSSRFMLYVFKSFAVQNNLEWPSDVPQEM